MRRCGGDIGKPLGERREIKPRAADNNWSRTLQQRGYVAQPVPHRIGRIKRDMPIQGVRCNREVGIIGTCRHDAPAVKHLQRIGVNDHAALRLRDMQGKRRFS